MDKGGGNVLCLPLLIVQGGVGTKFRGLRGRQSLNPPPPVSALVLIIIIGVGKHFLRHNQNY